jgi:hypothetical protein
MATKLNMDLTATDMKIIAALKQRMIEAQGKSSTAAVIRAAIRTAVEK